VDLGNKKSDGLFVGKFSGIRPCPEIQDVWI